MGLETTLAVILLLSLTCYALMGGADFGAGVWHLLARGSSRRDQHRLIGEAIGPIWEANHVWLILAVTILFAAFPPAYARISVTLHIPLTLLVIGIVLRGAAYAFRHYDVQDDDIHRRWDQVFAASSLVSPVLLGMIIGTITAGDFPGKPDSFWEGFVAPWIRPFPLVMGVFTLALFAYVAAVYLLLETKDRQLRKLFRKRAVAAALMVGVLEELVLLFGKASVPTLWGELAHNVWGGIIHLGVGIMTGAAIWLLFTHRYWWARVCAVSHVTLTIGAWGVAQFPYLVPPDLTVFNAASPEITLRLILIALLAGGLLLFPSLFYLFRIFKGEALFGSSKGQDG